MFSEQFVRPLAPKASINPHNVDKGARIGSACLIQPPEWRLVQENVFSAQSMSLFKAPVCHDKTPALNRDPDLVQSMSQLEYSICANRFHRP